METMRIWETAKFSNPQLILTRFVNRAVLMLIANLLQMSRILQNVSIVSKFSVVKESLGLVVITIVGPITATILLVKAWAGKLLIQLTLEQASTTKIILDGILPAPPG